MTKLHKRNTPQIKRQKKCLTKQQTSYLLIERAFSDHWIDALAFYHLYKAKYRNGRDYNHSAIRLSNKTGISPYLIRKYIDQLRDQGMVRWYGKHLQFISIYKFKETIQKYTIWINSNYTIQDIKAALATKYLEFKGTQQKKIFDEKIDHRRITNGLKTDLSLKRMKVLLKKYGSDSNDESIYSKVNFSYYFVATELNMSKSGAFRLLQNAKRLNKLSIIPNAKRILHTEDEGITFEMFKAIRDMLPANAWFNKLWKSIIIQPANNYEFREYPLTFVNN
jgi:hypothetical protein